MEQGTAYKLLLLICRFFDVTSLVEVRIEINDNEFLCSCR